MSYSQASSSSSVPNASSEQAQHEGAIVAPADFNAWQQMTRTVAHYERLEQIGEGTYGQVYRARCLDTGKIVAMKKMRIHHGGYWGMPLQLIREIKILKRLHHPNLLHLIEVVTSKGVEHLDPDDPMAKNHQVKDKVADARESYKGNLFLVLEYVEHDLTGLLDVSYQFTPVQIKCIFKQLLEALAFMHQNKYIHRDIKSSNLLLSSNFTLKLADFGLARSVEAPLFDQVQERRASLMSGPDFTNKVITLWYRPPEILLGAIQYDSAVDVWSAGCILAELILGKPLFAGKTELDQLNLILEMMGAPPSDDTYDFFESGMKKGASGAPLSLSRSQRPAGKFRKKYADKMSSAELSLIEKLLAWDPRQRVSAANALNHIYFRTQPMAPENPAELGETLQLGGPHGHFHEFQTKKKRKQAKSLADEAKERARRKGASEEEAQAIHKKTYEKLMKKVAEEGLGANEGSQSPAGDRYSRDEDDDQRRSDSREDRRRSSERSSSKGRHGEDDSRRRERESDDRDEDDGRGKRGSRESRSRRDPDGSRKRRREEGDESRNSRRSRDRRHREEDDTDLKHMDDQKSRDRVEPSSPANGNYDKSRDELSSMDRKGLPPDISERMDPDLSRDRQPRDDERKPVSSEHRDRFSGPEKESQHDREQRDPNRDNDLRDRQAAEASNGPPHRPPFPHPERGREPDGYPDRPGQRPPFEEPFFPRDRPRFEDRGRHGEGPGGRPRHREPDGRGRDRFPPDRPPLDDFRGPRGRPPFEGRDVPRDMQSFQRESYRPDDIRRPRDVHHEEHNRRWVGPSIDDRDHHRDRRFMEGRDRPRDMPIPGDNRERPRDRNGPVPDPKNLERDRRPPLRDEFGKSAPKSFQEDEQTRREDAPRASENLQDRPPRPNDEMNWRPERSDSNARRSDRDDRKSDRRSGESHKRRKKEKKRRDRSRSTDRHDGSRRRDRSRDERRRGEMGNELHYGPSSGRQDDERRRDDRERNHRHRDDRGERREKHSDRDRGRH